jgi:colicin import membrane protein
VRETRSDTRAALLQALGLHVLLFALMFAGLRWDSQQAMEAAKGEVIEADLVDPNALSASMQRALARAPASDPLPQPLPEPEVVEPLPAPVAEPEPEPVPPQPTPTPPPPVAEPAPVEQERVQRDAPRPPVTRPVQEQEERRRQPEQAELDAQRRLAEIRRQREQAARERTMAEARAQQLADARMRNPAAAAAEVDASASAPRGNPTGSASKQAQYYAALADAIRRQWTRPESVRPGQRCPVEIRQIPGGEVVSVEAQPSCPYDALGRRSVEAAVLKASPLPYAGFEDVFAREVTLRFDAADL